MLHNEEEKEDSELKRKDSESDLKNNTAEHPGKNKSIFRIKPIFRLRPTWNKRFGSTIKMLRVASHNAPKNITALRLLTDHSIPAWLPGLPKGCSVVKSAYPHPRGEW